MEGIEVKAISGREVELWIDSDGDLAIYLNLMGREEQSLGAWFRKDEATKIRDFINKYLEQATR